MSTLKVHNIEPATGTDVALGAAGDSITVSGDSLKMNTLKDAGGNTLFTSDGAGTVTSINTGVASGPMLISSQTASTSASVEFTSGIDSTYDKYMFVFVNIHIASNGERLQFQVSINGGTSYGVSLSSTYFDAAHSESNSYSNLTYQPARDLLNSTSYQDLNRGMGVSNDDSHSGILYLYAPSNTTYKKHFIGTGNTVEHGPTTMNGYVTGHVNTASAVNAITFKASSGNIDAGTFKLYGVK